MIVYRVAWDQARRNRGSCMFLHPGDLSAFTSFDNWEFLAEYTRWDPDFEAVAGAYRHMRWELERGSIQIRNLRFERAELVEPVWETWEPPADHWINDPLPLEEAA